MCVVCTQVDTRQTRRLEVKKSWKLSNGVPSRLPHLLLVPPLGHPSALPWNHSTLHTPILTSLQSSISLFTPLSHSPFTFPFSHLLSLIFSTSLFTPSQPRSEPPFRWHHTQEQLPLPLPLPHQCHSCQHLKTPINVSAVLSTHQHTNNESATYQQHNGIFLTTHSFIIADLSTPTHLHPSVPSWVLFVTSPFTRIITVRT